MPDPTSHLKGSIADAELANAAAAQPTAGAGTPRDPLRTPPPTGFQSPALADFDWSGQ